MADLYGGAAPSPASEPEEISSFLQQLLHNSSSSATAAADLMDCHHRSSEYSDPGGYFSKRSVDNGASSGVPKRRGVSVESDLNDLSFDSEKGGSKGSELPSDTVRHRSSSKRSRAAEVHNLSEKRRRSRINEKMKALQNLIPNSNKTDKASMLDEAIEYLKQLQLQVQMLTMRNGLSLHPLSLPGVLHPMQLPLAGMSFDEENGLLNMNLVAGTFSANEEPSAQPGLTLPEHRSIPNQSVAIPSGANINSSETSFSFEPLIQAQYGPFSLSTSSKEICREGPPQAQLDTKASSSGVS